MKIENIKSSSGKTPSRSASDLLPWIGSIAVHALLLLLFLLVRVLTPVQEVPEYSEMDFVSVPAVSPDVRTQVSPVSDARPTQRPTSLPVQSSISSPTKRPVSTPEEPSANVRLPQMKHLPDEQPAITEHKTEKISPTGKPFSERVEAVPPASGGNEAYPATAAGTGQPGDKPVPQTQGLTQQERTGNNVNADGDSSATGPYSIEGMASSRQVITEVLPEYPAGLNKEAVIKIRFSVLADGTIGEMAPLQKGEALLEEITMRAFRQWRFNALPATAPQTPQPGIITFQYRLHRGNP